MVSLEEAIELLISKVKEKELEEICLDKAVGRILGEDIYALINNPPFARSPLDGYAIKGEDTDSVLEKEFVELNIIDKIYAGYESNKEIKNGEAIRIMTGAPIPRGANCIVRQEDTKEENGKVKVYTKLSPYENYCYEGEDFKKGTKLLNKNTRITSSEIMAIASIGIDRIKVYKKPLIGIINTGDEIQNPGSSLRSGKIYNSNGYFLSSRIEELGAKAIVYNVICDEDREIISAIKDLEKKCDIIISTGGVSVGEKDRVKMCAKEAGYEILFWKIDMKPGSPMFGAYKEGKLYIGLSGTPVAAATSFELTARNVIAKMMGCKDIALNKRYGILRDDFKKVTGKRRFLRVNIDNNNDIHINNVYQTPGQVHTMINSNAILEIPPKTSFNKDSLVEVLI